MQRRQLEQYLEELLQPQRVADYCPNGLQVEGAAEVKSLVSGVTACQALLDAAVAHGADAILVHHGYFWKGEDPRLVGTRAARIATLMRSGISLFAYHLPLDMHPELGNNAQLARYMGWRVGGGMQADREPADSIGLRGSCDPVSPARFGEQLGERLGRAPLHIAGQSARIEQIAWCTGAAQSYLEQAIALGVDAYVTGEISEQTVHLAREAGIHFYAAGHHATERYGVQAVGEEVARRFGIDHSFIDIDNPV